MGLINKKAKEPGKGRFTLDEDIIILDGIINQRTLDQIVNNLHQHGYKRTKQVLKIRIDTLNATTGNVTIFSLHNTNREQYLATFE